MPDLKSTANLRFYTCTLPDIVSMLSLCDRPLYVWADALPGDQRPPALEKEIQRLRHDADQARLAQWAQCEASRVVSPPTPTPGVSLAVRGRLNKTVMTKQNDRQTQNKKRVAVQLALKGSSAPPPTAGCSPLPYPLLHTVKAMGINHYPQNTRLTFLDNNEAPFYHGIGPWEGSQVLMIWTPREAVQSPLNESLRFACRIDSEKVFDHWVTFETLPEIPENLLHRLAPFDPTAVNIRTQDSQEESSPTTLRGHGWRIVYEYTHLESGRSWITERFTECPGGWIARPMGGYGAQHTVGDNLPEAMVRESFAVEGEWRHRVCVMEFIRPPTPVSVVYQAEKMLDGVSSLGGGISTPYIPGVTTGEAVAEESVTIRTVGITKASFRLLNIQPVPGIGILVTLTVLNELHFPACIVTPFISGLRHVDPIAFAEPHFTLAWALLVRNLPAYSESTPVSVLVPLGVERAGDEVLCDRHWRGSVFQAFAAPLGQYPDGVYGFDSASALPELGQWPPPAVQSCSNPEQRAFLLAGIRTDGERIWNSSWDGEADLERPVATIPARLAPGAFLPTVYHPRWNAPTYFDQVPFLCFYAWTADANVGNDTWQPRSGNDAVGLDLTQALARYGRFLTLAVRGGRPFWSEYSQRWLTAFETWPGDTVDTLERYLIETFVRPAFDDPTQWRNFQYTSLKKPHLVTGVTWTYASSRIVDDFSRLQVAPLVKETTATDTVEVAIVGLWP